MVAAGIHNASYAMSVGSLEKVMGDNDIGFEHLIKLVVGPDEPSHVDDGIDSAHELVDFTCVSQVCLREGFVLLQVRDCIEVGKQQAIVGSREVRSQESSHDARSAGQ